MTDRSDRFELGTDGPSTILACIDGSPTSLNAGAWAAGMARRQGSRLIVLFVATTPALTAMAPVAGAVVDEAMTDLGNELRTAVEAGAAYAGIPVDMRTLRGNAYDEIVRVAEQERVDSVVVGASAQAGHRLVGSLAVRLVRAGKWPVTVVP
jgi:nucleotide-binding universal stress UspA family protein